MIWDNRKYHFYLLFADLSGDDEIWIRKNWMFKFQPLVEKILKMSAQFEKTGIETLQYQPRPNSSYFDVSKFGQLSWNERSHNKWTISELESERIFSTIDFWTPRRTICSKQDCPPDIYLSISNENYYQRKRVIFNTFIVVAIAEDINIDPTEAILRLSRVVTSKATLYKKRNWGGKKEEGSKWEFINSIQDTRCFGIYKGRTLNIHDNDFDEIDFGNYWVKLY